MRPATFPVVIKASVSPTIATEVFIATVMMDIQEYLAVSTCISKNNPLRLIQSKIVIYKSQMTTMSVVSSGAKSCSQLLQDGFRSNGLYIINPDGGKPMQVLCDMTTDGGGWTVFQRRLDGSVDFYLDWVSYKKGFGNLNGEFWLGNDNLHRLTAADDVTLRVDLEDFDGNITYAKYTTFKVADESDKYRLLVGGYSGTAGDSMSDIGIVAK